MATKPHRPCQHPGCPSFAVERGRCHVHRIVRIDTRPSSEDRGYTSEWRRHIRPAVLAEHPICQRCNVKPARDVHHIRALRQGGTHDRANLLALCVSCHRKVTAAERQAALR